ncbi:copper resistance CopC family protein [Propionicimonas sp.]|uniref:copper resistance CopC family protein n=1 Tax=Propionicimonas sp. TaxID=1955623 RepID=UPI002F3FC8FB
MGKAGRFVKVLAAVLMALVALQVTAQPAMAEDELLVTSDPYKHQELSDPPSGVVLAFSRAVDAAAAQIVVTNSAGRNVTVNSLIVEGTNVTAQVKPNLPKGTYTVHYQVNRKDGQVEGGAFQFAYGKGEWTALPDEKWSGNSAQPTEISSVEPDPVTETPVATETPTATDSATATAPAPTGTATPVGPTPVSGGANPAPWLWGGAALILAAGAGAIAWRRSASRRG